jgi:hypothetical protein
VITWNTVITTAAKNVTINKRSIIMMKKTGTLTEWWEVQKHSFAMNAHMQCSRNIEADRALLSLNWDIASVSVSWNMLGCVTIISAML